LLPRADLTEDSRIKLPAELLLELPLPPPKAQDHDYFLGLIRGTEYGCVQSIRFSVSHDPLANYGRVGAVADKANVKVRYLERAYTGVL
jgi:hypothetical protein